MASASWLTLCSGCKSAQQVERVASGATVKYLATPRLIENSTKFVNYELLQEYRENPTFNIVNYDLERRMDELELTAELQKLSQADGMAIGKRKPGRPPKNPTTDILTSSSKPAEKIHWISSSTNGDLQ